METKESIISKVKKILAKADPSRNDCEAEAVNAMRIAKRLMAENGLEMADVVIDNEETDKKEKFEFTSEENESNIRDDWAWYIVSAVNLITETKSSRSKQYCNTYFNYKVTFYGTKIDVAVASTMFSMLYKIAKSSARKETASHNWNHAAMRSYLMGFAIALYNSAKRKIDFEDTEKNKCYAVMVIDKDNMLQKWMDSTQSLKQAKARNKKSDIDDEAYSMGYDSGKKVSLNTNCIMAN
jgi:hypothetical protein